jgi:hypothetical protein
MVSSFELRKQFRYVCYSAFAQDCHLITEHTASCRLVTRKVDFYGRILKGWTFVQRFYAVSSNLSQMLRVCMAHSDFHVRLYRTHLLCGSASLFSFSYHAKVFGMKMRESNRRLHKHILFCLYRRPSDWIIKCTIQL